MHALTPLSDHGLVKRIGFYKIYFKKEVTSGIARSAFSQQVL